MPLQFTPTPAVQALMRAMTERLFAATPMLSWQSRPTADGPPIARNGSGSLLRTPQRIIGVTAAHVVDGYMQDKPERPRIEATLGGLRFDLEDRIIARSPALDIATFAVDERELPRIGFRVLEGAWPPTMPAEGGLIVFAGWPGSERVIAPDIVTGGVWTGICRAQISAGIIMIDVGHEQGLLPPIPGVPPRPRHYDVGGISGGPLMTILPHDTESGWRFGGVLIEGTPNWDIVRGARADGIAADGNIRDESPLESL
jgi:hypothetical protein